MGNQEEQGELLRRLEDGDAEAVNELIELYANRLLRAATLMLKDRYLAEDVVQDTLIDIVSHIGQFRGEASLYTWMYRCLLRRCRKKRGMLARLPVVGLQPFREVLAGYSAKSSEDGLVVSEAIKKLPAADREVVVLFYFEDLPLETISHLLKEPVGTVKSRLARARKKLAGLLGD